MLRQSWRRYRGQIAGIAAVTALILGVFGYGQKNPEWSIVNRCYAAIQLFSMSADTTKAPIPLSLEIARWLAPLTVAYAVFRTLSTIFLQQWTQLRIRVFFRQHVIICGIGQAGLQFAAGFVGRGQRVVAIDRSPSTAAMDQCHGMGIPVLTGDATEKITLAHAGVHRARYLIAVCDDDVVNAEVALALRLVSAQRRNPINCLIQLADERLCQLLAQEALTAHTLGPVSYEFFNVYQAGPTALLDTHADLLTAEEGVPPHLMIVGTGPFATALIMEAARRWRLDHAHLGRIRITLVAPNADAQASTLNARYPALASICDLKSCSANLSDPDAPTLLAAANKQKDHPNAALVCLEEDATTLRATLLMRRNLPERCPIIACTTDRSSLADLLERSASGMLTNVEGFSLLEQACRPEVLLNGYRETLAKAIHADYVRRQCEGGADRNDPALAPWDALSEKLRASNRAQAADLGEKLRAISCELVPATNWDPPPMPFTPAEVEYLAVLEHQRWETERRQDGWRLGRNRDPSRKLSPYLVPWNNLPEEIKDLDRDAIRALPTFLARAGFAIARTPSSR